MSDEQQKALRLAALNGDVDELDRLIAVGVNLDALGQDGTTPLMLAVKSSLGTFYDRGVVVVEFLLAHGADVNAKTESGASALLYAVSHHRPELVELLIKAGADVNAISNSGWSLLDYAREYGDAEDELIESLLDAGAESNREKYDGPQAPNTGLQRTRR
jgi:ankyrin repeat protein